MSLKNETLREFLDKKQFKAVCKAEELNIAINISSKFCVEKFSFSACVDNSLEISTFCASTIFESKTKKINGRKGIRKFDISKDLYNALTNACIQGYNPLPIKGYLRLPKKKYFKEISCKEERIEHIQNEELYDIRNMFTKREKMLIIDNDISVYILMNEYNLKRTEAETVCKNIKKKIYFINNF